MSHSDRCPGALHLVMLWIAIISWHTITDLKPHVRSIADTFVKT